MSYYWEFQIEQTIDGEVQDPDVFLSIYNCKECKWMGTLIPKNFKEKYVTSHFMDDGIIKRGIKVEGDTNNPPLPITEEFVIVKMNVTEDEGVINRDYIYLNEDGSLPNGLPQYVQKAFNKCIKEGESNV